MGLIVTTQSSVAKYQSTAPVGPQSGDKWINSDTGVEYTYITDGTSNQWVELGQASPASVVASLANRVASIDRRSIGQTPGYFGTGVDFSFMSNTTDGLADGGTYHGIMHFQPYPDASGGGAYELGFTDNNNLWIRGSSGALTTFAAWKKIIDTGNSTSTNIQFNSIGVGVAATGTAGEVKATTFTGSGSGLTALGTATSYQVGSLGVGVAASGTSGEIRATNNITAYYTSDRKFKEHIRDIPNAVDTVVAISGKLFDWTDEYLASRGGEDEYFLQKEDFGVIAQDVQKVFPQAIRVRPDGSLAVDYTKLGVLAFAAVKELKQELEAIKKYIGMTNGD